MRDVLFDAWTLPARGWLGVRVEYGREYVGSTCARMRACLSGHALRRFCIYSAGACLCECLFLVVGARGVACCCDCACVNVRCLSAGGGQIARRASSFSRNNPARGALSQPPSDGAGDDGADNGGGGDSVENVDDLGAGEPEDGDKGAEGTYVQPSVAGEMVPPAAVGNDYGAPPPPPDDEAPPPPPDADAGAVMMS